VEKGGRKKYITEEAPENSKELSHSAHANGMNVRVNGKIGFSQHNSLQHPFVMWGQAM
jgi:hypothetical protein